MNTTVQSADVAILENLQEALTTANLLVDTMNVAVVKQKVQKTRLSLSPRKPKSDQREVILLEQLKFELEARARWDEHCVSSRSVYLRLDEASDGLTELEASRLKAVQFLASDENPTLRMRMKIRTLAEEAAVFIRRATTQVLNGNQYIRSSESNEGKSWPGERDARPFVFATYVELGAPRCFTIRLNELDEPVNHHYNYVEGLAPYDQDGLFFQARASINTKLPCLTLEEATNIWRLMKLGYEPRRFALLEPAIIDLRTNEVVAPPLVKA